MAWNYRQRPDGLESVDVCSTLSLLYYIDGCIFNMQHVPAAYYDLINPK
jgi:hypothetical protein